MIVYRELATVERELGIPARTLYAVSNTIGSRYRSVRLPKKDGSFRVLSVPDALLMHIQRRIAQQLLPQLPVSPHARAYRPGCSVLGNAAPHLGSPLVLKLDILHFFDSVPYSLVKDAAFPARLYSEPIRILLALLCYCGESLPQGAPTSPAISNLILYHFDERVAAWCAPQGIRYTRYCDDMTFSGSFNAGEVIRFVRAALAENGFLLNEQKTRVLPQGSQQLVTGVVVNEKPAAPAAYRRQLRQELCYCFKFGAADHLAHTGSALPPRRYLRQLLGRVDHVLQLDPDDREFRQAHRRLTETLRALPPWES